MEMAYIRASKPPELSRPGGGGGSPGGQPRGLETVQISKRRRFYRPILLGPMDGLTGPCSWEVSRTRDLF